MNTKTAIIVILGVMLLVMCLAAQSAQAGLHCVTNCDPYGRNCQTTCLEW